MSRKTYSGFAFLFMMLFLAASPARVLAQQIGTDITSITTKTISSTPATTVNNVTATFGLGFAITNVFDSGPQTLCPPNPAPCAYTMIFEGDVESITGLKFAGGKASADQAIPARAFIRRSPVTDARQWMLYSGKYTKSTATLKFRSSGPMTDTEMLNQNNILVGYPNLFQNVAHSSQAIERVDFVLEQPVKAVRSRGFAVMEIGGGQVFFPASNPHDGFGIAAITSVGHLGNPTSYGPIFFIGANTWGYPQLTEQLPFDTNLESRVRHALTNREPAEGITGVTQVPGLPINPAVSLAQDQTIGGILIRTDELLPNANGDIYGYSLFAPDVTCTPETLVDVTDPCFPKNTPGAIGGLDLMSANLGALKLKGDKDKDK